MYGQSFREVGRLGLGPLQYGGGSLCWGRSVTICSHRSVKIPQVRSVHLARQYIALPRPWLPLRIESSVSRDLGSHVPQRWGSPAHPPLCTCRGRGCVWGGGIVGGEEGVGAVRQPVASWCVVVGGGEGVVKVMYMEGVDCWLLGPGTSPRTPCLKLLEEAIRATPGSLPHSLMSLGVALGPGWAMSGWW